MLYKLAMWQNKRRFNYQKTKRGTVCCLKEKNKLSDIEVPTGIAIIGCTYCAFAYDDKVQSVSLPDGVRVISKGAFASCPSS